MGTWVLAKAVAAVAAVPKKLRREFCAIYFRV